VKFAGPVVGAREINGQELPMGEAPVQGSELVTSFTAWQPRSFAVKLAAASHGLTAPLSQPIALAYDVAAATNDDTRVSGNGFDGQGNSLPAEMLPREISFNGVVFKLAAAGTGKPNAVAAKGQSIDLPRGPFNRVYILAAAVGDQKGVFKVGGHAEELIVQNWGGMIGQWDTRVWKNDPGADWAVSAHAAWDPDPALQNAQGRSHWVPRYPEDFDHIEPGYIKPDAVAWFASHHHTANGWNEPYQYSYLFAYAIDVPENARTLTLPVNDKICVLALTSVNGSPKTVPAQPLYDALGRLGAALTSNDRGSH
jgi:alpha-mannosidase